MYAELQVTSNFSFLRGGSHPEELIRRAQELGYYAIGISDRNTLAGVVRAHSAAKECGQRFLVASRLDLFEEKAGQFGVDYERLPCSLLLYPSDKESYGRLCSLLSDGKLRAPKGECFALLDDFVKYASGLEVIVVVEEFSDRLEGLLGALFDISEVGHISLAISYSYGPHSEKRQKKLQFFSKRYGLPLVATNDVYYHLPERRALQDVLTCIRNRTTLRKAGFSLFANKERFLKSSAEMQRLFSALPKALKRTLEIAERVSGFSLDQLRYQYPHEVCPENMSADDYLAELTWEGAQVRYPEGVPQGVSKQLRYELKLIGELDYAKYFLTVYDIVLFAREQGILCQGRGAAANSAVCYVLGITAVDPDRMKLLFERFVSKERNEPPDIDIDFEHERREEVIQYIYNKYGRRRAALVAEVVSYRTRSAVRDIGKVFELEQEECSQIAKLISRYQDLDSGAKELGVDLKNINVRRTIILSRVLRRFPRHLSQHVGGFVISEDELSRLVPIENAAMPDRTIIEWDKDDIDVLGMLKIDVLALGMLTCIRKALALLNKRSALSSSSEETQLELYNVPPEDPEVYQMISEADTIGVFQIESRAQMSMLPRLRPRKFFDLVIEVAIVRPGPIQGDMVHPYLRRRRGEEKVSYPDEKVRDVLEPTLGVPIFQEQVMQLSIIAAGFSPGQADQLRRAMGAWRKDETKLRRFREPILSGMKKNAYSEEFALRLFEQMQGFGDYGFPQSHAASFALLAYVSAWLKKHHPAAFAAALINSQPMGFYRPAQLIDDAKKHGVEVLPIDVNKSFWDCTLEGTGREPALRLGFRLLRSFKREDAEKISEAVKEKGPFKSLRSLWLAADVSVSSLKTLARADAFSSLGLSRQDALWKLAKFRDEPLPLFEHVENKETKESLSGLSEPQEVFADYYSYGLSLRKHPLAFLRKQLSQNGISTTAELRQETVFLHGTFISVAGMVLVRQRPMTASGVIFLTIEDELGTANLIVRRKISERFQAQLYDSSFLIASGQVQREGEVVHVLVNRLVDISRHLRAVSFRSRDFH